MKIIVKSENLLKALSHVQSVVERRNAVPILSNVKLECLDDGFLSLTTTDTDISIKDKLEANIIEPGAITVPAATLYDIVRKLGSGIEISIVSAGEDASTCEFKVNNSEFNLPCLPVADFPNFEINKPTHSFKISSEICKALFNKTRHAISADETRYYLNGVYMHPTTAEDNTNILRVVATDSHRLARAQTTLPSGCEDMPGVIIPKKTVGEVIKLLEDYIGELEIGISSKKIIFTIGATVLNSKLIEGKFPDYDRVIPKNNDKTLEVSRADLTRAIDLVTSVSNDKTRAVRFNIAPSKMEVYASSEMNGNARGVQEINVVSSSLEPITIGFNSRYVLEALSAIEGDTVQITFSTSVSAVIAQDPAEVSYIYILMPMQV